MATVTVKIKGFEEAKARIGELRDSPKLIAALKAAAAHIKGKINIYPPATEANSPSSQRWYERGYGPKWQTRNGVNGRKTSETLGRRWTIKVFGGQLKVEIGNNVSYGPYVHDQDKQASFHKARNWKTTEEVAKQEEPTVAKMVQKVVESEIRKLLGKK